MSDIADNLRKTLTRIAVAARSAGRLPREINLLAVSKTFGVEQIKSAANAGQRHFGENYLQEAQGKIAALPKLCWHFTGTVQSNKTKQLAEHFDWIHTLASEKAARRLNDARQPGRPLNVFVQVNISGETSKSGVAPEKLDAIVRACLPLEQINLVGLMAIPAPTTNMMQQRQVFEELRKMRDEIQVRHGLEGFTELSMGMSRDFEAAIQEGATWIRIGEGIFGARAQPLVPGHSR